MLLFYEINMIQRLIDSPINTDESHEASKEKAQTEVELLTLPTIILSIVEHQVYSSSKAYC